MREKQTRALARRARGTMHAHDSSSEHWQQPLTVLYMRQRRVLRPIHVEPEEVSAWRGFGLDALDSRLCKSQQPTRTG